MGGGGHCAEGEDDFCLALSPALPFLFACGWHFQSNNCGKNARNRFRQQVKMLDAVRKPPEPKHIEAQNYFADVEARVGWRLEDITHATGYKLDTLRKTMQEKSLVRLNSKMRDAIEAAIRKEIENAKLREAATSYALTMHTPGLPPEDRIIAAIPDTEEEVIASLIEHVESLPNLQPRVRQTTLNQIRILVEALDTPRPQIQSQSQ